MCNYFYFQISNNHTDKQIHIVESYKEGRFGGFAVDPLYRTPLLIFCTCRTLLASTVGMCNPPFLGVDPRHNQQMAISALYSDVHERQTNLCRFT